MKAIAILRVLTVITVVMFVASIVLLLRTAPPAGENYTLAGPAVASGVLGMFAAVGVFVLGFVAAVRAGD